MKGYFGSETCRLAYGLSKRAWRSETCFSGPCELDPESYICSCSKNAWRRYTSTEETRLYSSDVRGAIRIDSQIDINPGKLNLASMLTDRQAMTGPKALIAGVLSQD